MINGLVDTGTIYRQTETTDGYGGIAVSDVAIVTGWRYRKTERRTSYFEELYIRQEGKITAETFKFTGEYNGSVKVGDYIVESDGVRYEIISIEQKRNSTGLNHHMYIFGERVTAS